MREPHPRVAFFACAYNEVDGVAHTARQLEAFARRQEMPFLSIHGGSTHYLRTEGSVTAAEFQRGRLSFALDKKHDYDLNFWRHFDAIKSLVSDFRPGIVHITGPSDVGMLGALIAHKLRLPMVASWHTNVHEYARLRAGWMLRRMPAAWRDPAGQFIENTSLKLLARFYRIPKALFAPNPELMAMLEKKTGKNCFRMTRGVDAVLFNPERRNRSGGPFVLGYVGRITVEKNIELLVEMERALQNIGLQNYRFRIVGQGAAEPWLRENLKNAEFSGVLQGEQLATAYANMDAFIFPSQTDTFGNVVLEALASGVPAIVANAGGPKFIVRHGETGFVAEQARDFAEYAAWLCEHPAEHQSMRLAARSKALAASWDEVFGQVYDVYRRVLAKHLAGHLEAHSESNTTDGDQSVCLLANQGIRNG
jgi:glycosyltransferase involved in cell wall biosynthesis